MKTQTSSRRLPILISQKAGLLTLLGLATALRAVDQPPAATIAPAARAIPATPQTPPPPIQPARFLAWEADAKDYDAKPGELTARFTWYINVSSEVVVIRELKRSCGCTEAKLPAQPWAMSPGTNGPIVATIDLRGKTGRITKTLTVESSAGSKLLMLNVNIPSAPTATQPVIASSSPSEPATANASK